MCSCKSCPINITTEEGAVADSYGCLPSFAECIKWYQDTGKVWACHSNNKRACEGFLMVAKEKGIVIPVNDKTVLITEKTTLEEIYN